MWNHSTSRCGGWTLLICACVVSATVIGSSGFAETVPITLRQAEVEFSKGNWGEGDVLCQQTLDSADGAQWAARVDYLRVRGLKEAGNTLRFEEEAGRLLEKQPDHPYAARMRLLVADGLASGDRKAEAKQIYRTVALKRFPTGESDQARLSLLRLVWSEELPEEYLDIVRDIPEVQEGFDEGESSYCVGLLRIELEQDIDQARNSFERAFSLGGKYARKARAAEQWARILQQAEGDTQTPQSIEAMFQSWISETQGGKVRIISAQEIARRSLAYADSIYPTHPDSAVKICRGVACDPLFGKYSVMARAREAEWTGRGKLEADRALQTELEAAHDVDMALKAIDEDRLDEAIPILDSVISAWPQTATGRDARLRKGYVLYRGSRYQESAQAFADALQANADLGPQHPFNQEALARLTGLKHKGFYALGAETKSDPSLSSANLPLLNQVDALCTQWRESLGPSSPDLEGAALEKAGLVFERARSSQEPNRWETVREVLQRDVLAHSEYTTATRAVAALMTLETHFHERNYAETVRQSATLTQTYPGHWRELGTGWIFEYLSLKKLGREQEAVKTLERITDQIPFGAPRFASLNYHRLALLDRAAIARSRGRLEEAQSLYRLQKDLFPEENVPPSSPGGAPVLFPPRKP